MLMNKKLRILISRQLIKNNRNQKDRELIETKTDLVKRRNEQVILLINFGMDCD